VRGEGWEGVGSTRGPCLRFQAASLTGWLRFHPPLAAPLKGGERTVCRAREPSPLRGEGWVGVRWHEIVARFPRKASKEELH
jgi:hypothetical protein